jgi:hypothetical protein
MGADTIGKMLLGAAAGAVIGGLAGYLGRCAGNT